MSYVMKNVNETPTLSTEDSNSGDLAFHIVHGLIGVLGLVGNGLVLSVFINNIKSFQSLTHLLILHQSVIDFTSSLVFTILRLDRFTPLLETGGIVGEIFCRIWHSEYPLWALFMTSTLNLVLLSTERYMAVVHPVYHLNKLTRSKIKTLMLLTWIVSFSYQAYLACTVAVSDGECVLFWEDGTESLQTFVGILTVLLEYLCPLCIMSVEYTLIALKLRELDKNGENRRRSAIHMSIVATTCNAGRREIYNSSASMINANDAHASTSDTNNENGSQILPPNDLNRSSRCSIAPILNGRSENKFSRAFRNVIKTLIVVFLLNVVCWTPAELGYIIYNLGGSIDFDGTFHRVSVVLILCNMICNPFVYCVQYKEFQRSFKRTFCFCRRDNRIEAASSIA